MYAYLKGTLTEASPSYVTLEVNGMGFLVAITPLTFNRLSQIGQEIRLFTSFIVRENSQALYGFLNSPEKALFESLLDVSGVGPKLGLALTGHLSPEEFFGAITRQDVTLLSKVPGIGKKTAERLILELKNKTATLMSHSPVEFQFSPFKDQTTQDALSALINLGYSTQVAQKALNKTLGENSETLALGQLITLALKAI